MSQSPDVSQVPITVAVNGVDVPAVTPSGSTAWTFDAWANVVLFEPMFAPNLGDTVTIRYGTGCYP